LNGGLARLVLQKLESGGEVQFILTPKLNWTTGLHFAVRRFRDGDGSPTFANSWSFEERNRFDYALWRWPERRVRIDISALLRTGRVVTGAPSRLIIASGDLKAEWLPRPKDEKLRLSARFRSGGAFGTIPFDELFQLGVERDNDLWLRGHAGTRDGRKGSAPLGTRYALTQLEADRSVFERPFFRLQAGPFYDGGWISDSDGQFGSKRWLHDIGVQGKVTTIGNLKWSFSYGRDLRGGRGVFYTSVSR
jgi:hypothetical protein